MSDPVESTELTNKITKLETTLDTIHGEHKQLIRRVNRCLDNPNIIQETNNDERFKVSLNHVEDATYYAVTRETDHYDAETGQWVFPRTMKLKWEYEDAEQTALKMTGLPIAIFSEAYPTFQREDTDLYFKDGVVKSVSEWAADGGDPLPDRYQPVYTWRTAEGADILYGIGDGREGQIITPTNNANDYRGPINAIYSVVSKTYDTVESLDNTEEITDTDMVIDSSKNKHWYRLNLNALSAERRKAMIELMNDSFYSIHFRHTPSGLYTLVYEKETKNPFIPEGETLVQYDLAPVSIHSLKGCTAVPFGDKVIDGEWRIIQHNGTVFASNNEGKDPTILANIVDSINDGKFYLEMDATELPIGPKIITEMSLTMYITTGPSKIGQYPFMVMGQGIVFGVSNPARAGLVNFGGSLGNINATTLSDVTAASPGFQYALKIGDDWVIDKLDDPTKRDYRIFYFIDFDYAAAQFGDRAATRKPFLVYSRSPKELCIESDPTPE